MIILILVNQIDISLLQALDVSHINNLSSLNLSLYPLLKYLIFNINRLNELKGLSKVNQLKTVALDAEQSTHFTYDIDALLNNCMSTQNITELICCHFGHWTNSAFFDEAQFIKLLSKFPNIQYLSSPDITSRFETNEIEKIYPNLKRLQFACKDRNRQLLNVFANDMRHLEFYSPGTLTTNRELEKLKLKQQTEINVPWNQMKHKN